MKTTKLNIKFAALFLGTAIMISSCKKSEESLPSIDGFASADEIAATSLVAHWSFDGTDKEAKSNAVAATTKNATYGTGQVGQALKLAEGYLAYPEIASLNSLKSFTVSSWVNISNNGASPSMIFSLSRATEWAGSVNLMSETGWRKASSDTLTLKGLFVSKKATGDDWQDTRNEANNGGAQAVKGGGKWVNVLITYDGATSLFKVYANGLKVSNPDWEKRGTSGDITVATPSKVIIGGFGSFLTGGTPDSWQKGLTGQIDELRVYNKALTDGEIASLYNFGLAGR